MPTILDATVVASAYATSASARPQMLSNGWIVASAYDSTGLQINFYVDKRDGNGFVPLCYRTGTNVTYSVACKGTIVYVVMIQSNGNSTFFFQFDATTVTNTNVVSIPNIDTSQNSYNPNPSLTINEAKTELHATWASTNATWTRFNIRYAKGVINADGSVVWGSPVQITTRNTVGDINQNPTIVMNANDKPLIIFESKTATTSYEIYANYFDGTAWLTANTGRGNPVYLGTSYTQSSPSAIFVPQNVNGLANGRIWVAWHGRDATDTATDNLRVSYSDDGGVTWSAMQKLTSGNVNSQLFPSITANSLGEVFVDWTGISLNSMYQVRRIKHSTGSWGSVRDMTNIVGNNKNTTWNPNPSTLYDLSIKFTEPLVIYRNIDLGGVMFSGTWTVTTISVTQGSIGQKTDKANVLTYAITTDGVMSSITEKVNGVTIGTKTATSGQSLIAGLTQAQWDAVKFGKYKDVTGGLNTLAIEMGTEVFTYTFDKRPASDADMLSVAKAVQDSANVYLPAAKSKLGTAIRAKGGTVNDTDSIEVMAGAVGGIPLGKKFASGQTNSDASNILTVTGLGFKPSVVIARLANSASSIAYLNLSVDNVIPGSNSSIGLRLSSSSVAVAITPIYTLGGFSFGTNNANALHSWIAFE